MRTIQLGSSAKNKLVGFWTVCYLFGAVAGTGSDKPEFVKISDFFLQFWITNICQTTDSLAKSVGTEVRRDCKELLLQSKAENIHDTVTRLPKEAFLASKIVILD